MQNLNTHLKAGLSHPTEIHYSWMNSIPLANARVSNYPQTMPLNPKFRPVFPPRMIPANYSIGGSNPLAEWNQVHQQPCSNVPSVELFTEPLDPLFSLPESGESSTIGESAHLFGN